MFYRTLEGVVGVLCDWDLSASDEDVGDEQPLAVDKDDFQAAQEAFASKQSETENSAHATVVEHFTEGQDTPKRKARYRTGTGPFMALDLLAPGLAPVHLYRFDLESFFWVLIYFVATHNPEQHTLGRINQWADPNLLTVRESKSKFLLNISAMQRTFCKMHPEYEDFKRAVLMPLYLMFMDLEGQASSIRVLRNRMMIAETSKQKQEVKSLSQRIADACASRNDLVTFEKFMALLAVDI